MKKLRGWTKEGLSGAFSIALAVLLSCFLLARAFGPERFPLPSFDSLQRVEAVYVRREPIPLRVTSRSSTGRHGGGYAYSSGGGDNVLLNIKGEERWFLVQSSTRNPLIWSADPTANTPLVAYHDGARIWHLETREGSLLDYQTLAADVLSERKTARNIMAGAVVLILLFVFMGVVEIRRARAKQR